MSDTFLSRWARRKEAVRTAARSETPVPDGVEAETRRFGETATESVAVADAEQETALKQLLEKLPSLDSLTPESDLTAFLQTGVPTALRNAALRRMWSVDPSIRDFVSEAREYAYDWNTPGGAPGFGPLLPSDDVKAMLKRVVDGVMPKAEEEIAGDASTADTATSPAPNEADADGAPPAAMPVVEIPPLPSADSAPVMASEGRQHPDTVQTAPPRSRLRRHGGAMPS